MEDCHICAVVLGIIVLLVGVLEVKMRGIIGIIIPLIGNWRKKY